MAILIKVDGKISEVAPIDGESFYLREMYNLINCNSIEVIYINPVFRSNGNPNNVRFNCLIVDEEFLLKYEVTSSTINRLASLIYKTSTKAGGEVVILGNALLATIKDSGEDEETIS